MTIIKNAVKMLLFFPLYLFSKNIKFTKYMKLSRQPCVYRISSAGKLQARDVTIGNPRAPGFFSCSYVEIRDGSKGIVINSNTVIGNDFSIISCSFVSIGERCLIGNSVKIYDSDFHSLDITRSHKLAKSAPVLIADNVFIGDDVIILKGVNIGTHCIIGAGSVVTKSVPDRTVVAGNPAAIVRSI